MNILTHATCWVGLITSAIIHKPSNQITPVIDNELKMQRDFVVNYKAYYL